MAKPYTLSNVLHGKIKNHKIEKTSKKIFYLLQLSLYLHHI